MTVPSKFPNGTGADSALKLGYLLYMVIYTAVKDNILYNYLDYDKNAKIGTNRV